MILSLRLEVSHFIFNHWIKYCLLFYYNKNCVILINFLAIYYKKLFQTELKRLCPMTFAYNSKAMWRKNDRDTEGAVLFSRNNKKAPSDFFPPYALKLGSQATSTMTLETKKCLNNKFLKLFFFYFYPFGEKLLDNL